MTAAPPKIRLGEFLRARMRQRRLPQCELAKALAISPAAVSQLLSGRRSFRYSLLRKTCELLQLAPAECEEAFRLLGDIRSGDPAGAAIDRPFPFAPAEPSGDMAAEPTAPYRMEPRRLPVLPVARLAAGLGGMSLLAFAERYAAGREPVLADYPPACVLLEGSGREFGTNLRGRLRLVAAEERPAGFRELELVHLRSGGFRIRERVGSTWRLFRIGGGDEPAARPDRRLRLPILELTLLPKRTEAADETRQSERF